MRLNRTNRFNVACRHLLDPFSVNRACRTGIHLNAIERLIEVEPAGQIYVTENGAARRMYAEERRNYLAGPDLDQRLGLRGRFGLVRSFDPFSKSGDRG